MEELFKGWNETLRRWNKGEITKDEFQAEIKRGRKLLRTFNALIRQLNKEVKKAKRGDKKD